MDKEIFEHRDFVTDELQRIHKLTNRADKLAALSDLASYNDQIIKNFQHERQIHLMVTFFFGTFTIATWLGLFVWQVVSVDLT